MADGTTAFSIALANERCDIIKELLKFKRTKDIELARYVLLEPKINEKVKQVLEDAIGTPTDEGPQTDLSKE